MTRSTSFHGSEDEAGGRLAEAAAALRETERAAATLSTTLAGGLGRAMVEAASGGSRLGETARRLAADLSAAALSAAARPVGAAIGRGAVGAITGALSALTGLARPPRAFARGGVVQGAHSFPLDGGVGLVGEAGPEAILPLARGADGRLGVRSGGGGVAVTLNVSTPDAESFARSRGQVAAALARAVELGRRRL